MSRTLSYGLRIGWFFFLLEVRFRALSNPTGFTLKFVWSVELSTKQPDAAAESKSNYKSKGVASPPLGTLASIKCYQFSDCSVRISCFSQIRFIFLPIVQERGTKKLELFIICPSQLDSPSNSPERWVMDETIRPCNWMCVKLQVQRCCITST